MDNVTVQVGSHGRVMLWDWYPKRLDIISHKAPYTLRYYKQHRMQK